MKFVCLLVAAASAASSSKLIGTKQDCCRYNGAQVGVGRKYNGDFAKCEAGCKATKNCNFLSYNKSWKACTLCSKCDLSSKSHGKRYNSYKMIKAAPAPTCLNSERAVDAEIVAPMVARNGYVWFEGNELKQKANTNHKGWSPKAAGGVTFKFDVKKAGKYSFSAELIAPNGNDNSFYVTSSVDHGSPKTWSTGRSTSWVWHKPPSTTGMKDKYFPAGTHSITLKPREDGTKVRALRVTNSAFKKNFVTENVCFKTARPAETRYPTAYPTGYPTRFPTAYPTRFPTAYPTRFPTAYPTHACPITCELKTTPAMNVWQPGYTCDDKKNFIRGQRYSQIALTDGCRNGVCNANPKYGGANSKVKAIAHCKKTCDSRSGCTGFFFQTHGNGHEICGFYTGSVNTGAAQWHGHKNGAVCTKYNKKPAAAKKMYVKVTHDRTQMGGDYDRKHRCYHEGGQCKCVCL